jgi:hypothetical protein
MDTATASQELQRFTVAVAVAAHGAAAQQAPAAMAAAAQDPTPLQAPRVQQTPVAVAVAVQLVVQLVDLVDLVLSLFVMPMSPPLRHSLLQSQSLQDNHTHSMSPHQQLALSRPTSPTSGVKTA